MSFRVIIYILVAFMTTYSFTGININGIFKKNHIIEARIFVLLLILAITELVSSFIINFLEASRIL